MKNFLHEGVTLSFQASEFTKAGNVVSLGSGLMGVNSYDVAYEEWGEAQTEGVFIFPKATADTPAAFAKAYWNGPAGEVTTVSTDTDLIGVFTKAYGAGAAEAEVKLIPHMTIVPGP
ncbi:hypothetical protein TDB9533_01236 [Thalassocella blandensis]|nr:hypothetical protein TDB9533_01236 [Thalassocella blandensis]